MDRLKRILIGICIVFLFPALTLAQEVEKFQQEQRQLEEEKLLRERIEEKKEEPVIEEPPPEIRAPLAAGEKVLIKKINVTGVTLIPEQEIQGIISPFENKEIGLEEMQKVVDLITDAYRKRGYVTSRAYLPPQKIQNEVMEIMAVEGVIGDVEIKGNRFFRTSVLRKAIRLQKGEHFDYKELRRNLSKLNEHPDRNVKAVLAPGKEAGATDIVLEVTDNLPLHLRLDYDNYASRYVDKNRYTGVLSHNNIFGFDDIVSLQYQTSDGQDYTLIALRYLLPVSSRTKLGFSISKSALELGREFKSLEARGKSRNYSIFAIHDLIKKDDYAVTLNAGFDYLDSFNFQLGDEQSRDRLRVVKLGADLDASDSWARGGRTIISPEIGLGLADFMGGLEEKDSRASRVGSGGKFIKYSLNLIRLQNMPLSSMLLWKSQAQTSPYTLTASQQFQLGGISNVRGYPSGEYVGDRGISSSWEWLIPPYFLPKDILVPFSKAKFYDALKLVAFYDWGYVNLRQPQPGERKNSTLRSLGWGIRFNLPENFSIRADFAWSVKKTPSDGDRFHPWVQVSKEF
ncbi:MAG: ShlB/FhaC/HecB family hemolysin secretion/activation protein [Candidatus Omnitrophota bacterium]